MHSPLQCLSNDVSYFQQTVPDRNERSSPKNKLLPFYPIECGQGGTRPHATTTRLLVITSAIAATDVTAR